jgi:2-keto-4-pentenoate hydratase/2-oxohepta-3-ene-1,7-dioic acid hydratase in catechol pathway
MKIARFVTPGESPKVGALAGDRIVDMHCADPAIPDGLLALIEGGEAALDAVARVLDTVDAVRSDAVYELDDVRLLPAWPGKRIAMVAANYPKHTRDAFRGDPSWGDLELDAVSARLRENGLWGFWKTLDWVSGPDDELQYPRRTQHLDYEGEVAIILSRPAKDIDADRIQDYVWGVTLVNDWSDRDVPMNPRIFSYNLAKNFDGSASVGPYISVGEVDPHQVDVMTHVNGELRQSYNTAEMVFDYGECLAHLTRDLTLVPGDMLSGGTGAGTAADIVGIHQMADEESQKWFLQPGDVVEVSSPQIGVLRNRVVSEVSRGASA